MEQYVSQNLTYLTKYHDRHFIRLTYLQFLLNIFHIFYKELQLIDDMIEFSSHDIPLLNL